MSRSIVLSGFALLLAACGAAPPRVPTAGGAAAPRIAPAGVLAYRLDPEHCEVRVLVYRAGALARLGHNHVIVNRALGGWAVPRTQAHPAAFYLEMPVDGFIVDDPDARAAEGVDFSATVADDARSGTREHLLGPAQLDAGRFPDIIVSSLAIAPVSAGPGRTETPEGSAQLLATVEISVAGHTSRLDVPFVLNSSPGRVTGAGSVVVRQSALGLTPYAVMLGALEVQDEITIRFSFAAVAPS